MKRHVGAPEVTHSDLESPNGTKAFGQGHPISMAGAPPMNIQPYQAYNSNPGEKKVHGRGAGAGISGADLKKVGAAAVGVWVVGIFLGFELLWPITMVFGLLESVLSIPPFSWIFSIIWTPFSWIFGFAYRGAPMVEQTGALQELRLPTDQVPTYLDSYVQQYGDAALIFATHDGYPQLVNGLLYNKDLGYMDLLDASDENGNTALIYAASKGYRQCTAALLRSGADPDIPNQGGGGRTPLMEAAGGGHKDIVAAIRLSNATIDLVDVYGNTALHYAAYHGHLSVVHELLKGNPRKDIQNTYGHTAASYASSNKHKAIADLLTRAPSKRELALQAKEASAMQAATEKAKASPLENEDKESDEEADEELQDLEAQILGEGKRRKEKKGEEKKRVKGKAEDLHERDDAFAPKVEKKEKGGLNTKERKALEDQLAKLKRKHEDAELKSQKRIVELLEKSSNHQQAMDDAQREIRAFETNYTELALKVQELESKHKSSELRASDEKETADRLAEEMETAKREAERHQRNAEGAEKERDMHIEAAKRHEERLKEKHEEVKEHLQRLESQQKDLSALRGTARQKEEELRQHREMVRKLQHELALARGESPPEGDTPAAPVPEASAQEPEAAAESTEAPSSSTEGSLEAGREDKAPEAASVET
eukprot:CAMPEP_0197638586 /NCGR_PEP_ID=MMETSP1338-20131121/13475_1 /TAXON_ID=43686 ORGANISM="Pelagodinium beii, Strain RCC1491" /NCGR_SAMPLE_ID=MMETSP1338 /ASSEMBLY_ACC=CAM_ASM_000754 /LENGTH=655 /DNA_ID=CAMNT_0043211189 /DNA_START=34 /DNA_END=2001 /DNA_ORIENTATION=+